MRRGIWIIGHLAIFATAGASAQSTRAERTGYRETSSYADVLGFLDSLQRLTGDLRVGTLAHSPEGRRVPLAIAARPMVWSPAGARRSRKPVVYLQANIHGGEVEGKEAAQMLLRDLTVGGLRPLLDSVVLLSAPIYNADGNERLGRGDRNRPGQNGPALVGENPNGQYLNLNRDYVKLEAPETRGAVAMINAWDPDLFIDLHTTNGSYHGYVLTYAPGLNPNPSPANEFVRDRLLPAVRERMRRRYRQETFWYGNFRNQEPDSLALGWETYDPRPRFGTNWMGLRGRLAILSEGYSNADFRTRVSATYHFVREILSLVAEQPARIDSLIAASDRRRPDSVMVRSVLGPPTIEPVIAELTRSSGGGSHGFAPRRRTGVYRTIRMPVYDRFSSARAEARPAAYLIPARLDQVADLLRSQGIQTARLTATWRAEVESFTIDSVAVGTLFEGHRTVTLEGRWGRRGRRGLTLEPGWYLVPTDQPLGVLAACLLEPASEDGLVTWNYLDRELAPGADYPILRVRDSVRTPAETEP